MRASCCCFVVAIALAGCGESDSGPDGSGGTGGALDVSPEAVRARLQTTLDELAAIGPKISGTPGGVEAGNYLVGRFEELGFEDVALEPFSFPSFALGPSSLSVTVDGAPVAMEHAVFHYSGAGQVDAEIVDLGTGHEQDYQGKDVTGKVVLVVRDPAFHRQSQARLVLEHGGAAMLYVSQSPENLIQIGTVADPEDGLAQIPTVTVGKDDGDQIIAALAQGQTAHATIDVSASIEPATGQNVVARLPGTDPSGAYLVVGAHYDTWHVGSTDNGTGVATLLELAAELAREPKRRLGLVFVGYDGEELGLFGGYDYLRKHVVVAGEPMLGFINLEMPGAGPEGTGLRGLAHTKDSPVNHTIEQVALGEIYPVVVGMEAVPALFGGLIPTDIQGMYWWGLHGLTTYCETPYYHTPADTPDKVDMEFLTSATLRLGDQLRALDIAELEGFSVPDPQLWSIDVTSTSAADGSLDVSVSVRDAAGTPQDVANVRVWVDVDDFTRVVDLQATTDAQGNATVNVPASALSQGAGARYLHVTAGRGYALGERIQALP